jgi:hypothetical protein
MDRTPFGVAEIDQGHRAGAGVVTFQNRPVRPSPVPVRRFVRHGFRYPGDQLTTKDTKSTKKQRTKQLNAADFLDALRFDDQLVSDEQLN